jgi:hypothetical protein
MESIGDGRRCTVAQGASRRPFTAEARLRSLPSSHVIFGRQNGNGTGCSLSKSFFACQYHSINSPYSFAYHCSYSISVIESVVKLTLKTKGRRGIEKILVEKSGGEVPL